MKSLKTRIATTALAGTMALSLAAPALAVTNTTTKVTASYSEIPIDVVVPTTATVQLNPMEMPVKLPVTDKDSSTAVEVSGQLVSMPAAIINNSSMDLTVGATVTGTVKGAFKFATAGWDTSDDTKIPTTNSAFVYLEMKKAESDVLNDEKKAVDNDKIATEWSGWDSKADLPTDATQVATWAAGTDDTADAVVVLAAKAVTADKSGLVKLDAAVDDDNDGTYTPQEGSVGLFRLDGQVAPNPKTAWAKTDGFGATIAFTFKASKPATPADP